ncbi:MAG: hypothetical protein VX589_18330 [Myxococcota bacterium]|nr:hypothetical protein [Myxococcota bacterium]
MESKFLCTVKIKAGKKVFDYKGGVIQQFAYTLDPNGFEASFTLVVDVNAIKKDEFLTPFLDDDLIEIDLTILPLLSDEKKVKPKPTKLSGIVVKRDLEETAFRIVARNKKVGYRVYKMTFVDPAQFYWRRNFPILLYRNKKESEVIKAQTPKGKINLSLKHAAFNETKPLICLASHDGACSFYDYVHWRASALNVVTWYDYDTEKYNFDKTKPKLDKPEILEVDDVRTLTVGITEPCRSVVRIKNSYTEATKVLEVTNKNKVQGLYRDRLVRTPIAADLNDISDAEKPGQDRPMPRLNIDFNRYPMYAPYPGTGLKFHDRQWNKGLYGIAKTYRCVSVSFEASLADADEFTTTERLKGAGYACRMSAVLENSTDDYVTRVAHTVPTYPIQVEAVIVTDDGKEGERVYQFTVDNKTKLQTYRVDATLWSKEGAADGDAKEQCFIDVPFEPLHMTGFVYFPLYKDSRVLLNVYHGRAEIFTTLDWGAGVQLPKETQGQNILLGKNKDSQTAVSHTYVDNKPVFNMGRNDAGDTQTITLKEGLMILEVKANEKDG